MKQRLLVELKKELVKANLRAEIAVILALLDL